MNLFATALGSYQAIGIINLGTIPNAIWVSVVNQTTNLGTSCAIPSQPNALNILYLPISCIDGDSILISIAVNAASTGGIITAWGMTFFNVAPLSFRPDGRAVPIGQKVANATAAGNIVNGQAGNRSFIHTMMLSSGAGGTCSISATVSGVTTVLLALAGAGAVQTAFPLGLLTDTNTAISLAIAAAANVQATCVYDRVGT